MLRMNIEELEDFLKKAFPQAGSLGFTISKLEENLICLELTAEERHLRPGGTVSGPVLMTLADSAAFLMILARLGPVALAVTTNLNIHFMRKPNPGDLVARCSLLKLGKRMAVCEVQMHGADSSELYAHATVTYSLPPST